MKNAKLLYARYALALPLILSLIVLLHAEHALMQADADPTAAPPMTIPIVTSGKWVITTSATASDGLMMVGASLTPEGIDNSTPMPLLSLLCIRGQFTAGLRDLTAIEPTLGGSRFKLEVIYDEAEATETIMAVEPNTNNLSFENSGAFLQALSEADQVTFRYRDPNENTVELTFDTRGFLDIAPQLGQACPNAEIAAVGMPPAIQETTSSGEGFQLGSIVMTQATDRDGCATTTATTFDVNADRIYVVAEDSDVAAGTAVFVRWYLDSQPYEDAPEIVADQDYENICISFSLEPDDATQFRAGSYEAAFIINGNPAGRVAFEMQ